MVHGLWAAQKELEAGVDGWQEDGCRPDGQLRCNFSQGRGLEEDGLAQLRYPCQK